MAKQANGSVTVECGNTVMLAAVTMSPEPREGIDFFPLTVEYSEKMYAAGKIPGGFFKREAKPRTGATLTARLIDRPLRPSFPKNMFNEVQVVLTVLSYDETFSPEFMGIIGASAALSISDIPFNGPIGAALVCYTEGQFIFNPTQDELKDNELEIVVAGTKDAILMVEAEANEVSEDIVLQAIAFAHKHIIETIQLQEDLVRQVGKTKVALPDVVKDADLESQIRSFIGDKIALNMKSGNKKQIDDFLKDLEKQVVEKFENKEIDNKAQIKKTFSSVKKEQIRDSVIKAKIRPDGRRLNEIRPIEIEVGLLPSAHGSALFTRGETQSLGVITLGTSDDEQMEDGLRDTYKNNYYFHYNFPPFSVGEVGRVGFTSRRELGHGALAEKSLRAIMPSGGTFPYTVRIVSEILESNGSSSMASVCSGTLSLMDCGVPIKSPVSGIAMGLLIDGGDYVILSDIQGLEDHYGDMDFKVAGTINGITALQLDIKVAGLSEKILKEALAQAKEGRLHILNKMLETLAKPRPVLSPNAPKIETFRINPEKVGLIIGPGGKMIRKIEEESKASVAINDGTPGEVCVSAKNQEDLNKAKKMILDLAKDVEVGEVYQGKVVKLMAFGAFIEVMPGKEGLLHVSRMAEQRVNKVEDYLHVGQAVEVKVFEVDAQNRINLELTHLLKPKVSTH